MVKRSIALFILSIFLILTSGCETTKGIVQGIGEGIPKDTKNFWQALQKADDWVRKNLW